MRISVPYFTSLGMTSGVGGSDSDMFESWEYAGFTKDETRKTAFKKYEEWRKANPINED